MQEEKKARACIVLTRQGRQLNEQGLRIVQMAVDSGYPLDKNTETGEYVFSCGLAYNDKERLAGILEKAPDTFVALCAREGVFALPSGPDGPGEILGKLSSSGQYTSWAALRELAREVYHA